jgi:hypothetical protein
MGESHEVDAGERRCRGRLDDHRTADSKRWDDLVDDQVQGMVEGGDGRDHTDRLMDGEGPAVDTRPRQPHRDLLAARNTQHVGGVPYSINGTVGLDQRIRQRLAALAGNLMPEVLA